MNKLSDYYLMTYEQQEEWKRNQNKIEQATWETDRAREDADRAQDEISRLNKIARQKRMDEADEENELIATIEQQQTQIAALLENLQYISSVALDAAKIEFLELDDGEEIEVTMTVKAIRDIRAALEAAEGKTK